MIFIASDHAGFDLKGTLVKHIKSLGLSVTDEGPFSAESVDYPDYAQKIVSHLNYGSSVKGILICGTGIGMSIAANRYAHIRAALCQFEAEAKFSRLHNDANVLCLGARIISVDAAISCLHAFLTTEFEGARHALRVNKLGLNNPLDKLLALEYDAISFGFDWPNHDMAINQVMSECLEVKDALQKQELPQRVQEEISDLLHAAISLCVYSGFDVHDTFAVIVKKFGSRLAVVKALAHSRGLNNLHGQSFEYMLQLWAEAKKDLL
ncbi:MAG: ribose 5-phosphate isomerase B [Candidatus Paracaedibacteraceae bacterium]|nr:ribose 5-phosphate isomerase B [Candidatus Paracaedibacteraceae bacterium]